MSDKIAFQVAESESDRKAAYRLRYEVFTIEEADQRYANHDTEEYKDSDDVDESVLFVAKSNDRVVGTARLKILSRREFIAVEQYHLSDLAARLKEDLSDISKKLGCMDRLVVSKTMRGGSVAKGLADAGERFGKTLQIKYMVGNYKIDKTTVGMLYSALGYQKYAVGTYRDVTCQCMFKVL